MESFEKNSIKVLASHEYDLVFGGGKNDCVCYMIGRRNRRNIISRHDVEYVQCVNWCCFNPKHSFSFKHGDLEKCPFLDVRKEKKTKLEFSKPVLENLPLAVTVTSV